MIEPKYFEDFRFGETFVTRYYEVTVEEAVAFAEAHDPQPFHTDAREARDHPLFRGLSASGLFTMSVTHRLVLAAGLGNAWGLIGKGIDNLRWPMPIRPGDLLRVEGRVIRQSRDPSKPVGTIQTEVRTLNQDGEAVMTMVVHSVVPSRRVAEQITKAA